MRVSRWAIKIDTWGSLKKAQRKNIKPRQQYWLSANENTEMHLVSSLCSTKVYKNKHNQRTKHAQAATRNKWRSAERRVPRRKQNNSAHGTLDTHCPRQMYHNGTTETKETVMTVCLKTPRAHVLSLRGEEATGGHDTEEMGLCGDPIWVRTLSSHWSGPERCTSIQQGVEVTSWRWYSAPQPFTKLMRMVHIFVSS